MSSEQPLSFDEIFKSSFEKHIWGVEITDESNERSITNSGTIIKQFANFILAFKHFIKLAICDIDDTYSGTSAPECTYIKRKYFIKQKDLEQEWFNKVNTILKPIFIEESLYKDDLEETCDESKKIKSKDKPREIENCESDESGYSDKYLNKPVYETTKIDVITYNKKVSKFIEKIVPTIKQGESYRERAKIQFENVYPTIDIITEYYKKKNNLTATDINKYLETLEIYCNFVIYYCANRCKVYIMDVDHICVDFSPYIFHISLDYDESEKEIYFNCHNAYYSDYCDDGDYSSFTINTLTTSEVES